MATLHASRVTRRRVAVPDLAGGGILVAIMVGALFLTRGWEHNAALFPRAVCTGAAVLGLGLMVRALVRSGVEDEATHDPQTVDDKLEYIFHTASRRLWLVTVGWFAGFFVSLYVLGLYPTAIVYAVAYLRTQDRRSWLFSGIYATVLTGILYVAFSIVLTQPVPSGFFGLS